MTRHATRFEEDPPAASWDAKIIDLSPHMPELRSKSRLEILTGIDATLAQLRTVIREAERNQSLDADQLSQISAVIAPLLHGFERVVDAAAELIDGEQGTAS